MQPQPRAAEQALACRLSCLDLGLFSAIRSQSTEADKQSWLAIQLAVREMKGRFSYLEIGSYLGGSLQPYLLDQHCTTIYSIDARPAEVRDDRGSAFSYADCTTARMIANLKALDPLQTIKVICFTMGAEAVPPAAVVDAPDICFIDGEQTHRAVLRDFAFCRRVCANDAVIYFHDANVVFRAIALAMRRLSEEGVPYRAVKLGGSTFAIALRDGQVLDHPLVQQFSTDAATYLRRMRLRRLREQLTTILGAH